MKVNIWGEKELSYAETVLCLITVIYGTPSTSEFLISRILTVNHATKNLSITRLKKLTYIHMASSTQSHSGPRVCRGSEFIVWQGPPALCRVLRL